MQDAEEGRIDPVAGSAHTAVVITDTERLVLPTSVLETYGVGPGDRIRFSRNPDGTFSIEKLPDGDTETV